MNGIVNVFIKYVGLNILGTISTAICIFVDYWFIATAMGTDGLTALSLALPVYSIINGVGLMLGVGGGAKYAELKAKDDDNHANNFFTLTVKSGCIFIIFFVLIGCFFTPQISALLGAEQHILPMTSSYVRIILLLSPGLILYHIFSSFARNSGSPKTAMISAFIFNAMNIVLDYIFIMVFGWEMFGASLATTLASFCALLYLLACWGQKKFSFRFVKTRLIIKQVMSVFEIGGPSFIGEFLYGFVLMVFNLTLLNLNGNVGVAAFGIVSSIAFVVQYIFIGLAQGIQPMVSNYYGKKDRENIKRVLNYSLKTAIGIALVVVAAMFLFTESITSVLNSEEDVILAELVNEGARIYFSAFIFVGITYIATSFLSVSVAPKVALILSILQGGALIIPLVFILSKIFGVIGAWLSYPISELLLAIISIYYLLRTSKFYDKNF